MVLIVEKTYPLYSNAGCIRALMVLPFWKLILIVSNGWQAVREAIAAIEEAAKYWPNGKCSVNVWDIQTWKLIKFLIKSQFLSYAL